MSYTGDKMIEYEESHWQELAEKFIQKHYDDWCQFVADEFSQHMEDREPPDHYKER